MSAPLVLLFKSPKEGCTEDPYITALKEVGFKAVCLPALGFKYLNSKAIYTALSHPANFSSLLITSQNGVKGIEHAVNEHSSMTEWHRTYAPRWRENPVFVVGPATAEAVRALGLNTVGEETGNGETLFPLIKSTLSADSGPVLYPCGNLSRDVLPSKMSEAGLELRGITVYETGPAEDITDSLRYLVETQGTPQYVVYFSPSGINYTYKALDQIARGLHNIKFIAIGPTTENALKTRKMNLAATADHPTPSAVVEALLSTLHQ